MRNWIRQINTPKKSVKWQCLRYRLHTAIIYNLDWEKMERVRFNLVRAARGGKSKRGGTSTIGGGGSLLIQFPISLFQIRWLEMDTAPDQPCKSKWNRVRSSMKTTENKVAETQSSELLSAYLSSAPRLFQLSNGEVEALGLDYSFLRFSEHFMIFQCKIILPKYSLNHVNKPLDYYGGVLNFTFLKILT